MKETSFFPGCYCFIFILMPYNMMLLYFRLPYFHVSNSALFSTYYFRTLILHRRSLDTFYGMHLSTAVPSIFIIVQSSSRIFQLHDDVIKWKHFPRYWPFAPGGHRSPVNSPHKGQWRGALMFSLNWVWMNSWVNNREAGDLRRHRAHYDVTVMGRRNYYFDTCITYLCR